MHQQEDDPTSCFLKEMALKLLQKFSNKELEIIWDSFKLDHRRISRITRSIVNSHDNGVQSQIQKIMMINYQRTSNRSKLSKQNSIISKKKVLRYPFGIMQNSIPNQKQTSKNKTISNNHSQQSFKTCIGFQSSSPKFKQFSKLSWKQNILQYQSSLKQFVSKRTKKKDYLPNSCHHTSRVIQPKDSSVPRLLIERISPNSSAFQSVSQTSSRFRSTRT